MEQSCVTASFGNTLELLWKMDLKRSAGTLLRNTLWHSLTISVTISSLLYNMQFSLLCSVPEKGIYTNDRDVKKNVLAF